MSAVVSKACAVRFPTASADSTGRNGVHRIAVSTTAGSFALPRAMRNNYVKVAAYGCDVQCAVSSGAAGQTLVSNQAAALGTGHVAAGATIKDGTFIDGIIPSNATFLNVVAVSGSGFIEVYVSEVLSTGIGAAGAASG